MIDHLRPEWTLNPQYNYGWAVPFFCAYLLWTRLRNPVMRQAPGAMRPAPRAARLALSGMLALAFAYAPTRLIQEANPEWRLVSWALAIDTVGLTLLLLRFTLGARRTAPIAFAVCFFLVAVPWPTVIEAPLIQGLTRLITSATIELVNLLGVPALQHGNVIEVGTGAVGIDDACSGIRSFQATLMLSLFFGELYTLTAWRRALCVCAGLVFSLLFNLLRTTLLTLVAARNGTAAIAAWHDPASVTILVACFLCLWLIARSARRQPRPAEHSFSATGLVQGEAEGLRSRSDVSVFNFRFSAFPSALLLWLLVVEAGTELWYRTRESNLPPPITWTVELPRDNPTLREIPLSDSTRRLLRFDESASGAWTDGDHREWQLYFLRWSAGHAAGHLAVQHTPQVCLPAQGYRLTPLLPSSLTLAGGLRIPFRAFRLGADPLVGHVFYCRWADRATNRTDTNSASIWLERVRSVWAGRGNQGLRVLEVALWGIADDQQAEIAFQRQLESLLRPTSTD